MKRNSFSRTAEIFLLTILFLAAFYHPVTASPIPRLNANAEKQSSQSVILEDKIKPPVAHDDTYSTEVDTTLSVSAASGVLANDSSSKGLPLTAIKVSSPSHGSLVLNPGGSFTYKPSEGYKGADEFKYKVSFTYNSVIYYSNTATVKISVRVVNDPPVAASDSYTVTANIILTVPAPGVLANDHDPQGTSLTAVKKSNTTHGVLTMNSDGSFSYTPNKGFIGQDKFSYAASDGSLQSTIATVQLYVIDDAKPVVNWIAPVDNQGIYNFSQGFVTLEVNATDNVSVDHIRFIWWNSEAEEFVELGAVTIQPYQLSLDTTMLNPDWNQIFALAYDTSGNASERQFIWLLNESKPSTILIYLPVV
ncbi:MAG: cadherin-like domain-containing protein, partial [Omnitrophica WOR_2 bacterium]